MTDQVCRLDIDKWSDISCCIKIEQKGTEVKLMAYNLYHNVIYCVSVGDQQGEVSRHAQIATGR